MALAPAYTPDPHPAVSDGGFPLFNQSLGLDNLSPHLDNVLATFYILIGGIAVIYLIYSGIRYISANGNKDAMTQARQGIIYAVLGIIIIMTSYAIIAIIASVARSLQ